MLQETRSYAQSMVYAHANLRDLFVQVHADPHSRARLRAELARLALARAADRWYQGSGATVREGSFFGYSSRRSAGARGLGTVLGGVGRRAPLALLVGQRLRRAHVGRPRGARQFRRRSLVLLVRGERAAAAAATATGPIDGSLRCRYWTSGANFSRTTSARARHIQPPA